MSDQGNGAAPDGWSKMEEERKTDGKAKSENDKGSLGARLIHDPVARAVFFFFCCFFFSFLFSCQTLGFGNGKRSHKKRRRQFQLIGSRSLWPIGSMSFLTWQDRSERTQTHTRTHAQDPDTCPCAVTFYLSSLFIIVRQCQRQTGKGYDVNE